MKRLIVVALASLGATACADDEETFLATLIGASEVPAVTTTATGTATFTLLASRLMSYQITLSNIQNVTAAHIHDGAAGVNGDIMVTLYGGPQTGSVNGTLTTGQFDQSAVSGGSFEDLLGKMRAGTVYVNVHTQENAAGEVRGQVRPTGTSSSVTGS